MNSDDFVDLKHSPNKDIKTYTSKFANFVVANYQYEIIEQFPYKDFRIDTPKLGTQILFLRITIMKLTILTNHNQIKNESVLSLDAESV